MIQIRRSNERGYAHHGWLEARHSFSFAGYHDPKFMGFSALRVINEDRIAPGMGFGTHGHQDMEIFTYMISGSLRHEDSMGNSEVIVPGDVQYMSAGQGVRHSELNASESEFAHLLQIWIQPNQLGVVPRYGQTSFPLENRVGRWCCLVSPDGGADTIPIHQEAEIFATLLDKHPPLEYSLKPGRKAYVQIAKGVVKLNGQSMSAGDGAFIDNESHLILSEAQDAEVLLFDLP